MPKVVKWGIALAVLLVCAGSLHAQCPKLVINPITGSLDCAGTPGSPNITANSAGAVTSLVMNLTPLGLSSTASLVVQCWTGTSTETPVAITSLNPLSTTSVTANFASTANVTCVANATGQGPAGATGATGTNGTNGTNGNFSPTAINSQSGASYTFANTDCSKEVRFNNASAVAITLPQAGSGGNFAALCSIVALNNGAGTVTITPTTSTLGGASSQTLAQGQNALIISDGSNYDWLPGKGSSAAFNAISSGTNSSATMTCGTGCTVTTSGTGVNNANQVNGGTVPTSATVLATNGSNQPVAANITGSGSTVALATSPVLTTPHVTTIDDGNGNPFIASTATASAVDSVTITNSATASPATVVISATGSDSNINLNLVSKGSGTVQCNGSSCGSGGSGAPAALVTISTTTGTVAFNCPSSTAGTVVQFAAASQNPIQLSGNLTMTSTGCTIASRLDFIFQQAASSGPFTITVPAGWDTVQIHQAASVITKLSFDNVGHLLAANTNAGYSQTTEVALPGSSPPSGFGYAFDSSTDHTLEFLNPSGLLSWMPQKSLTVLNNQANTYTGGGLQDLSAVDQKLPVHSSDPATCSAGQIEFNSTGTVMKVCTATNTWTTIAAGGTVNSGTQGQIGYYASTGTAISGIGPGTAKQLVLSNGTSGPQFIDFPEVLFIPAANCNNTTAGAGWSVGSGGSADVTCRAGTNNKGGFISITDTSTTFATFQITLPEDWDSASNPFIRFQIASTDTTTGHTIIPSIQVACYKGDGTTTDDVAANAAHSLSTTTLNTTSNQFWSTSNIQMNSTDMTGCVAGALMQITVGRATDTATNAEFYGATVTIPRLLAVQAN